MSVNCPIFGRLFEAWSGNVITRVHTFFRIDKELVDEVVDEAIGVALDADDWDPSRVISAEWSKKPLGLETWFIFMKSWHIAEKILREERRYQRACSDMVRESSPEYGSAEDCVLQRLDLERALPMLSPEQRSAISLVYLAQLSIEECALVLKISRGAMDGLLCRARKRLRELLESSSFTELELSYFTPPESRKQARSKGSQSSFNTQDPSASRRLFG